MDIASKVLCWASNTFDWEISNVKPPCWNGKYVQYKDLHSVSFSSAGAPSIIHPEIKTTVGKGTKPIRTLVDSVDTNTLHYIASQHAGECYFDTLQNILMFADGFREINAPFAKDLFIKYPKELLNDVDGETITKEINDKFTIGALLGDYNKNLNRFLANTFRRYILIKLAEKGKSIYDIQTAIGGTLNLKQDAVDISLPPLGRNPSINLRAGIQLKKMGDTCVGNTANRLAIFSQLMEPEIYKTKFTIIDEKYKSLKYDNKELIGVFMIIDPNDNTAPHALGIIRNNNKYYIIDNNVGISIEVTNIDKFDGNNFIVKYNKDGTYEYLFGSDSIKIVKSLTGDKNYIYTQSKDDIFIYYSKT